MLMDAGREEESNDAIHGVCLCVSSPDCFNIMKKVIGAIWSFITALILPETDSKSLSVFPSPGSVGELRDHDAVPNSSVVNVCFFFCVCGRGVWVSGMCECCMTQNEALPVNLRLP